MPETDIQSTQGFSLSYFNENPPKSEAEIVAFVELKTNVGSAYFMHALHRQWYEDLLWYYGEQYLEFNTQTRRFSVKQAHPSIPRCTTNMILPKVEVGIQLFLESMPAATVKPKTREVRDRMAAEVAQYVRRHLWNQNDMDAKRRELAGWVVVTGNGFMLDYLDNASKERVRLPIEEDQEVPVTDELGRSIPDQDPFTGEILLQGDGITPVPLTEIRKVQKMGPDGNPEFKELILADVNTMVVSPFEIVPDFSARHPWEQNHFIHHRAQDIGWLKDQFGAQATDGLKAESGLGTSQFYQYKVLELISRSQAGGVAGFGHGAVSGGGGEFIFMENSAVLKTYYEIPSDKFSKGRIFAVANNKVLYSGPYSDLYGEKLCLGMYGWSKLPGSMYHFGMVRPVIDLQRRLNGLDTQRTLLRKTMGNAQWLAARGVNFSVSRGSNVPGYVYTYRPRPMADAPMRLDGKGPPPDWEQERSNMKEDMQELTGIYYALAGQNPPGITAGVSLDILTESAGKRFKPMIEENRAMARRQELNRLKIAQKAPAWSVARTINVIGDDGEMEAKQFSAADFTGEIDIEIEAVTPSIFSESQKKSDYMAMLESGLIDQTLYANRERGRKLMGLGDFEEGLSVDTKKALWENQEMLAGRAVAVMPIDNHEAHMMVHEKFLKRTDLNRYDPAIVAAFVEHTKATAESIAEQMMEMADAQMAEGEATSGSKPNGKDRSQDAGRGPKANRNDRRGGKRDGGRSVQARR